MDGARTDAARTALTALLVLVVGVVLMATLAGCGGDDPRAASDRPTAEAGDDDPADQGTEGGEDGEGTGDEEVVEAEVDGTTCSPELMTGSFIYEVHGDQQFAEGFRPVVEVGLMLFDGEGGGVRIGTSSSTVTETESTFTYEVGERCSGTITTDAAIEYRATFSPTGDEVSFFAAGQGGQRSLDGQAERADESTEAVCDQSTLTGTYMYRARGSYGTQPHIEHGFEVYDGEGGVTNVFRVAGEDAEETLTGTYEVGEDCHAVVTYDTGVTLDQYVTPDGEEFFWLQTGGFDEPGLFGGHEHRVSDSIDTTLTTGS